VRASRAFLAKQTWLQPFSTFSSIDLSHPLIRPPSTLGLRRPITDPRCTHSLFHQYARQCYPWIGGCQALCTTGLFLSSHSTVAPDEQLAPKSTDTELGRKRIQTDGEGRASLRHELHGALEARGMIPSGWNRYRLLIGHCLWVTRAQG
jgi:hypothetical protein